VGELSAVEKVRPRFFKLKASLERGGAGRFVRTFLMDGSLVAKKVPGRFDRVLVDAPCSSEARIHLDEPASWEHWSERKVVEMSRKQKRLLVAGARALKPGGLLVYSTCSYSVEENEAMVAHALEELDEEFAVEDIRLPFGDTTPGLTQLGEYRFDPAVAHTHRVLPDGVLHGFFVARLRRRG
ncbi:MAG: RsmB/NOP family class I SAM-dependent RNA methyltransferase, partial [Myxococcota bacterium]